MPEAELHKGCEQNGARRRPRKAQKKTPPGVPGGVFFWALESAAGLRVHDLLETVSVLDVHVALFDFDDAFFDELREMRAKLKNYIDQ